MQDTKLALNAVEKACVRLIAALEPSKSCKAPVRSFFGRQKCKAHLGAHKTSGESKCPWFAEADQSECSSIREGSWNPQFACILARCESFSGHSFNGRFEAGIAIISIDYACSNDAANS